MSRARARRRAGRCAPHPCAPQGAHGLDSTRPVAIDNRFSGCYLFAFDQRLAAPVAIAEPGYGTPSIMPTVRVSATAARPESLGPVTGPPPPTVTILPAAALRGDRVLVARVACRVRCRTSVEVSDGMSGAGATTRVTGSRLVGVPRRRLRAGHRVSVSVQVGAGPLVSGRSRLS